MNITFQNHWLFIGIGGLLLLWAASLLAVRFFTRRQLLQTLTPADEDAEVLDINLPDPRVEDRLALDLIRSRRRAYLLNFRPGTEFSFRAVNDLSLDLIRGIAQVYYPQEERPELKASLADLVALHNRVGTKLAAWLETFPMRAFKDLELGTIVRAHEIYQSFTTHPVYAFTRRHHLDKVVRWGLTVYNYANPWHWGGRAAYHGGKEVAARLLLARIASLVGGEAIRLYGRQPQE